MTYREPARTATRRIPRIRVTGVLVGIAAATLLLAACRATPAPARPAQPTPTEAPKPAAATTPAPAPTKPAEVAKRVEPTRPATTGAPATAPGATKPAEAATPAVGGADAGAWHDHLGRRDAPGRARPPRQPQLLVAPRVRASSGPLGEADGAIPDGATVFDDEIPGVANLDPALLRALRRAATNAADDAVELFITSGWRSPKYQERLLREAVSTYGSEEEAARWVATPNTSAHVSGDAVDIGPFDAIAWLSKHGAKYGLCQVYLNEPWHYELRTRAIDHGCPATYADPTRDPRMQGHTAGLNAITTRGRRDE